MSEVLARIVAARRARLPELWERYGDLRPEALPPSARSLKAALRPGGAFILECKRASPSRGVIRPDYRPAELARTYSRYAAAISVLTEPDFFGGDFAHLQTAALSTHLPVLCKDFVVDDLQILVARWHGADAVLLMLSVLDDGEYARLAALAGRLNLDVLTEVASEAEMARAAALGADIVGINHRDLRDLSIDTSRSAGLAPLAPPGALLVAESGLADNATVRRIAPHVHGFLVGSSLCSKDDVDRAARRLIHGEHKVCGLTTPAAAQAAAAAGAVYGGLIFAPRSPRRLSLAQAGAIVAAAPELDPVAVYTGSDPDEAAALAQALPLHAVQLHGGQGDAFVTALRERLNGVQIWYALDMTAEPTPPGVAVDRFVLDSGAGGSGRTFDWARISPGIKSRALLAGGLNPENAPAALQTGVLGLDFNSGLERERGVKDAGLIARAFAALRRYPSPQSPQERP